MEDIFELKKDQLENAYQEFIAFYLEMDKFYTEKEVSETEMDIAGKIVQTVNVLQKRFKDFDGDELTRAEFVLAQCWLSLTEITANRIQKSNALGRWVKYKKHNEWKPAKKRLEENLAANEKRVLVGEIEAEINKKLFAESVMEGFYESHADKLIGIQDSVRGILTALSHRINLKRQEATIKQ